jgi:hypothetical protein
MDKYGVNTQESVIVTTDNMHQNIYFLPINYGIYHLYRDKNPKILSPYNTCLIKEKEEKFEIKQNQLWIKKSLGANIYQKDLNYNWDVPFVTILAAINHKTFEDSLEEVQLQVNKEKYLDSKEKKKHRKKDIEENEKLQLSRKSIEENASYLQELEYLNKIKEGLVKHDKRRDLYPVLEMNFFKKLNIVTPIVKSYIDMVLSFFYGDYDEFKKHYKDVFLKKNLLNIFFPVVNNKLTILNEEMFWYMIYLLPEIQFSSNNIILMMRYSHLFPSALRDKIKSFIVYHLFLWKNFKVINNLIERGLVSNKMNFLTDFICNTSGLFTGLIEGNNLMATLPIDRKLTELLIIKKKQMKHYQYLNTIIEAGNQENKFPSTDGTDSTIQKELTEINQLKGVKNLYKNRGTQLDKYDNLIMANIFIQKILYYKIQDITFKKIKKLLILQKKYKILLNHSEKTILYGIILSLSLKHGLKVVSDLLASYTVSLEDLLTYARNKDPKIYDDIMSKEKN